MKEIFKLTIKSLISSTSRTKNMPVAISIYNCKLKQVVKTFVNEKGSGLKTDHRKHAEAQAIEYLKQLDKKDELVLVITLIPCNPCLNDMMEVIAKHNIKEIYYLFDYRGKKHQDYIKQFNKDQECKVIKVDETILDEKTKRRYDNI